MPSAPHRTFFTKSRMILCAVLLVLVGGAGFVYWHYWQVSSRQFRVTFLDVGQGDASLIQFGNGEKMLVDCGANKVILARLGQALPFYDRTIDYLLVTHPDLDHYGGCLDVLKRYRVKKIITNGKSKEGDSYWQAWDGLLRTVVDGGARQTIITGHDTERIGQVTLEFFSPDPRLKLQVADDDSNNYSIVFRLIDPTGKSYLFTGDMELPLEHALLAAYCPDLVTSTLFAQSRGCMRLAANVLKVGHHGSKSSTGWEFIEAVRPVTAVVQSGKNNRYGHPSPRVLKNLERSGARILRTDELGDILLPY